MSSKIEDLIAELQDYVDSCPQAMLKSDSIVVKRDEIDAIIDDLRLNVPDEIKQYQRIINNQEHILSDARSKADKIIKNAEIESADLVAQHQIINQAYAKANELVFVASQEAETILNNATKEANQVKANAMSYTDDQLKIIQEIVSSVMETTKSKADNYLNQMQGFYDIIMSNRSELAPNIAALYAAAEGIDVSKTEEVSIEPADKTTNIKNEADANPSANSAPAEAKVNTDNTKPSDKADDEGGVNVPDVFFNKE